MNNSIIIRAGLGSLSFLVRRSDGTNMYHPYQLKNEMSMAANLREAFRELPFLAEKAERTVLLVSTPVVLMPREDYENTPDIDIEAIYSGVITERRGEEKLAREVSELEAVALFSTNHDLHMVVADNYQNVEVQNVMIPVWKHLYKRYYQSGQRRKLFAYFHDRMVDVCCFEQRRVRFANAFESAHAHDALYYILYVWKQLGMDQQEDDLFVIGDMPHEEWLRGRLGNYLSRVHDINPNADLNRSPLAQIEGMPFDMMLDLDIRS